jgi:hypothetical protein
LLLAEYPHVVGVFCCSDVFAGGLQRPMETAGELAPEFVGTSLILNQRS